MQEAREKQEAAGTTFADKTASTPNAMMYRLALLCAAAALVVKRADGQECTSHGECDAGAAGCDDYPCYCKIAGCTGDGCTTSTGLAECEDCVNAFLAIATRHPLQDTFAPIDGTIPDACAKQDELKGEVGACEMELMRCLTDPECVETFRAPDSCGEDFECDGDEEFDLDRCCGEDICEALNECYVLHAFDDDDDDDDDYSGIGATSCYTGMYIAIAIVAALLIVVGIVLVVFCCCCRNKNKPAVVQQQQPQMMQQQQPMMVQQPMVVSA